jgi:hypothetical protein
VRKRVKRPSEVSEEVGVEGGGETACLGGVGEEIDGRVEGLVEESRRI